MDWYVRWAATSSFKRFVKCLNASANNIKHLQGMCMTSSSMLVLLVSLCLISLSLGLLKVLMEKYECLSSILAWTKYLF